MSRTSDEFSISPRELEVLVLLARGLSDAEIAAELSISARTVGSHTESIRRKLGVTNRTQAVVVALKTGLILGD